MRRIPGSVKLFVTEAAKAYLKEQGLDEKMEHASHIVWATGGSLVPETMREEYKNTF